MATVTFWLVTFFLATWAVVAVSGARQQPTAAPKAAEAPAPAPSADCTSLIYNMVDCVTFLSVGSNETKPDTSCCSGLKTMLNTDAECICEGLKSSVDLGVDIDMKKAKTLPSACKVSAPSLSSCNISSTPLAAPPVKPPSTNPPPKTTPTPKSPKPPAPAPPVAKAPAPAPAPAVIENQAPAPSPVHSKAYAMAYSSAVHLSMVVVSFLYFLA